MTARKAELRTARDAVLFALALATLVAIMAVSKAF